MEEVQASRLYKVTSIKHLTPSAYVLNTERDSFHFKAGQYVTLGFPGQGVNREYTLYSGENDAELSYLIKDVLDGTVSPRLKTLKAGDQVEMHGPYSEFFIEDPADKSRKYLFIGSGTGIAPFHAMVRSYPDIDYSILHGIREAAEDYDRFDYGAGRYTSCVSRGDGGEYRGRVTDYLREHPVEAGSTYCYICGNRKMINEVYAILREQGVSGTSIFTEVFF